MRRLEQRQKVPKDWERIKFMRQRSEVRPFYNKLNSWNAIQCRSPMVSLIFPSMNDKRKLFEGSCKKRLSSTNIQGRANTSSKYGSRRSELDKIVMHETKNRRLINSQWKI